MDTGSAFSLHRGVVQDFDGQNVVLLAYIVEWYRILMGKYSAYIVEWYRILMTILHVEAYRIWMDTSGNYDSIKVIRSLA